MAIKLTDRRNQAMGGQKHHRAIEAIKNVAWHYSGVMRSNGSFITNHESWWRNGLGWLRGGYHFYIDKDGNIYWNYDLTTRSNGVANNNQYTVNICVEAGSASDYTPEQEKARQELTLWLLDILPNVQPENVLGHREFPGQNTSCPGYSTAQMNEFRRQLAKGNKNVKTQTTKAPKEKTPSPRPTGQRVHLPSSASSWRVYKRNGPYTVGNEIGFMRPSKFGGLSYDILGSPMKDVVHVNTRDWGTVAIYVAKSTGATISGSGAGNAKPKPSPQIGQTLHLPSSAKTWRVYRPSGPFTVGNEIHLLTPSAYGGLTYEIKGNPAPDVYLIDTQVKGRVAIYTGPRTGAKVTGRKNKPVPKPKPKAKTLHLPKSADTWRVYKPNGPYTVGNEVGFLSPKRYGGLSYTIQSTVAPNVHIIQTAQLGRVAIYTGPETGATIK